MSPLAIWNQFFTLEESLVPLDPDELEVVCCDTTMRVVSHIGVELENCIFNSAALQELRRQAPSDKTLKVQLKFNRGSMAHIWVKDPKCSDRIQVLNTDPDTSNLSADQVGRAMKLKREMKDSGQIISTAQAIQRMRAIAIPLLHAKTQAKRRQARKVLGIESEPNHHLKNAKVAKIRENHLAPVTVSIAKSLKQDSKHKGSNDDIAPKMQLDLSIPKYNVVKTGAKATINGVLNADQD